MPMSSSRSLSTVAALEPDDAAAFRPLQLPMQIGPLALNRIRDNLGARPKKRRVGRGVGSGRGRHCGRGMKGRKQRAGNHNLLRNDGGQTRLQKKLPKLGHWRPRLEYVYINLCKLQDAIKRGHLTVPTDRPIGVKDLFDAKLITLRQRHSGVHLMARGGETFDMPLNIEVQLASQRAIEVVEAAGGSVESVYYSRLTLRALLKPHRFEAAPVGKRHGAMRPRPALPPPKLMRDIYMSERHRGYLRNLAPGDVVRPQVQGAMTTLPRAGSACTAPPPSAPSAAAVGVLGCPSPLTAALALGPALPPPIAFALASRLPLCGYTGAPFARRPLAAPKTVLPWLGSCRSAGHGSRQALHQTRRDRHRCGRAAGEYARVRGAGREAKPQNAAIHSRRLARPSRPWRAVTRAVWRDGCGIMPIRCTHCRHRGMNLCAPHRTRHALQHAACAHMGPWPGRSCRMPHALVSDRRHIRRAFF